MGHEGTSASIDGFVSGLFEKARKRRAASAMAWGFALSSHALAFGLVLAQPSPAPARQPALELALLPPDPIPQPEPAPAQALPPPPMPEQEKLPSAVKPASAAPPEPARAAALVTSKADVPTSAADDPVDFTNDPTTLGFGAGVVAIGGKAHFGRPGARPASSPAGAGNLLTGRGSSTEALTPLADLGRKPSLGESDPCRGYFPAGATDDLASASVMVVIAKSGAVSSVSLVSESPPKQGFGAAARACMLGKRFNPALDRDGKAASTSVRVNVRFSR